MSFRKYDDHNFPGNQLANVNKIGTDGHSEIQGCNGDMVRAIQINNIDHLSMYNLLNCSTFLVSLFS